MNTLRSLGNFNIPSASGPGVHADELDSAWQTVRGMLPASTARELLRLGDIDADLEPRSNPSKKGPGAEPVEDKTIAAASLAYPTMLITGQWGKPPIPERHRSLPLHNPPKIDKVSWDRRPFFVRMGDLSAILGAMAKDARAKYLAKRPAVTDLRDQMWAWALLQCQADVDWVISQKVAAYDGQARVVRATDGVLRSILGISDGPGVAGKRSVAATRAVAVALAKEIGAPADDVFWRNVWGIVAAKGNGKLPFAAYSTAPMASCPAAGGCKIEVGSPRPGYAGDTLEGYCYSVKAWRYPDAFARQFRNLLAETADREFAILAGFCVRDARGLIVKGSGAAGEAASYEDRVRAALTPAGRAARSWHRLVALEVVRALRYRIQGTKKKPSAASFFRLYVDGDINTEDNIIEWMKVCFDIGPGGELVSSLKQPVEVYGYSKCWQQFVNAEAFLPGMRWPTNYALNMSADSIYRVTDDDKRKIQDQERRGLGSLTREQRATFEEKQKSLAVQERTYALPIRRGYFESIDLTAAVKALEFTIDPSSPTGLREFTVPPASQTPFPFDESRIRTLIRIDRELTAAPSESQAVAVSQRIAGELGLAWVAKFDRTTPPTYSAQIRSSLYRTWFAKLMDETDFGRIVERELAQDDLDHPIPRNDPEAEKRAVDAWRKKTRDEKRKDAIKKAEKEGRDVQEELAKVEAKLGSRAATLASKRYQDKALALALHETLWAFGRGGSCPLVCGNCPDTTGDDPVAEPVHRCASKGAFKGAVIYIGRH